MAGKNTAVFGIYKNSTLAERAVDRIIVAGFSNNDISVLLPDSQSSKEFAHEKNTKAPEGTTTGVTTGGVVGHRSRPHHGGARRIGRGRSCRRLDRRAGGNGDSRV